MEVLVLVDLRQPPMVIFALLGPAARAGDDELGEVTHAQSFHVAPTLASQSMGILSSGIVCLSNKFRH